MTKREDYGIYGQTLNSDVEARKKGENDYED
jgi:hypothetical protein